MPFPKQWVPREPYHVSDWDLRVDPGERQYWVDGFRKTERWLTAIARSYPQRTLTDQEALTTDYLTAMEETALLARFPERLDVYVLDRVRKEVELAHGLDDPYRAVKVQATTCAEELLPGLLRELDACRPDEVLEQLARGLMTGNLFDVGSDQAVRAYGGSGKDFHGARDRIKPRPWWRDDADRFWAGVREGRFRDVAWFVDNAGGDICLGVVPVVRWLLGHDVRVTLLANAGAALNDILIDELPDLLERIARHDERIRTALSDGQLRVLSNGNDCPLMDLGALPIDTVTDIADADLLVLHGMGRGIESNIDQRFTVPVLRTAVVKDVAVADRLGAGMFDCQFWLQEPM